MEKLCWFVGDHSNSSIRCWSGVPFLDSVPKMQKRPSAEPNECDVDKGVVAGAYYDHEVPYVWFRR